MRNISISANGSRLRDSKHDFLETSVPDCTTYDVIALWPDVTNIFYKKLRKKMHHKLCKISAWSAHQFGVHFRKKTYGGLLQPSLHGRVLRIFSVCDFKKYYVFHKYMEQLRLVQVYYMPVNETDVIRSLCGRLLGCQMTIFWRSLSFLGDELSRIFKIFKNEYPNRQKLTMTRRMSPGNRTSDKTLAKKSP